MSKKSKRKPKHIPQRTCVGCKSVQPKRSLIRIVRTTDGIKIDPSRRLSGRGAYLHENHSCWEAGINNSLSKALRTNLSAEDIETLSSFMSTLREDLPSEDGTYDQEK